MSEKAQAGLGFREIAATLRNEILDRRYPTASVLPPEPELALKYGASRSLVNRAMNVLAAEGLVRPRQGRGTIVTWLPPITHSATAGHDPADEILALGLEPRYEVVVERAEPPADIADVLGVEPGQAGCLARRSRLLAGGIPVRLTESWFPLTIAENTLLEDPAALNPAGTRAVLSGLGFEQTHLAERITPSRLPTEPESRALEISPERTVTDIGRTGRTADRRAVEITTIITPAHYLVIEHTLA
ncbi:GntR family transcriptional regulator [Streptomyces sp. NPDC014894]|uniref:GntR family transcriptional regulator n=1 Tax=Streptomyces sp. NPDC014894 TaxID=3364931 RepID=UPI0036FFFC00